MTPTRPETMKDALFGREVRALPGLAVAALSVSQRGIDERLLALRLAAPDPALEGEGLRTDGRIDAQGALAVED